MSFGRPSIGPRLEQQPGLQWGPQLTQQPLLEKTAAKRQGIISRLGQMGQMSRQGMAPSHTHNLRSEQFKALHKNYATSVQQGVENSFRNINTASLESRLYSLGFSDANKDFLERMVRALQQPLGDKKKKVPTIVSQWNGRTTVWVGRLHEYVKKMQAMVPRSQEQAQFIQEVISNMQSLIAQDPVTNARHMQRPRPSQRQKEITSGIGKVMRMFGLMAASGLAMISGVIDVKNKQVSFPTVIYAGLAAWAAKPGAVWASREAREAHELKFLTTSGYENLAHRYNIRGRDWAEIGRTLRSSSGQRMLKRAIKGEISQQEFVQSVAANPNSAAHQAFRNMAAKDILMLNGLLGKAKTRDAQQTLWSYIENGLGPQNLAGLTV